MDNCMEAPTQEGLSLRLYISAIGAVKEITQNIQKDQNYLISAPLDV